MHTRIYLDNAATSWPKPDAVYRIVERWMRELGAPTGRGGYREASEVERLVQDARLRTAQLLGTDAAHRVVFTCNGTDSLNLALHGLLRPGDHVVTTVIEHNSVLRPLRYLEDNHGIDVTRVACGRDGIADPDQIRKAIRSNTRLIAMIHVSNVTGAIQPVEAVGRIAKEHGALYLVDAAQSVGHLPVDVAAMSADLLAAPGHKGLLGPLGCGFLYVAPGVERQLHPVRQGGTGSLSVDDQQPLGLPDRYEAGNHNVPGILGMGAGAAYVQEHTVAAIQRHDQQLLERLIAGLREIPGVTIHGPTEARERVGVVSISVAGFSPQELAATLDAACSIQVRAGLHCAPMLHRALGTLDHGGTVRFSLGVFTTPEEIDETVRAIAELSASF
jgi:cysteine desulfurase/selenocysteine lyase